MNIRQLSVIIACVLVGTAIFLAPRVGKSEKNVPVTAATEDQTAFNEQLESVKKSMDAPALAGIEFFESRLEQATGIAKSTWLDSLSSAWDRQMRPGIAAEYVYRKAEITNNADDWFLAGKRYLGISRFFQGEDKVALNDRASICLEKANELKPGNNETKTMLGAAYVEGGKEPMKGIFLLREVVAAEPGNVDAQLNLGFFSMQSGQYDKAEERFKTVIGLKPDLAEVRLYLAEAMQAQGKNEEALKELREIKNISSDTLLIQETERRIGQIELNTKL
ncbi:MAG: tetratricopeptide repeat protein [Bacteroidia bacterium]